MEETIAWLLERDAQQPGVRLFALTDLLGLDPDDGRVSEARAAVMDNGPVPTILRAQSATGYWEEAGTGYYPKYRGTVWSVIYLAQLGANGQSPQVRAAGNYLLENARAKNNAFSLTGTPSGNIHCLSGNLGASLLDLGFGDDQRLVASLASMAHYINGVLDAPETREEEPVRYLKSGACGPGFRCSANNSLPCAWGAVKALRALARIPEEKRTLSIASALETAVDFLLSVDPATAGYPAGYSDKPSRSWFRLGFPVFYVTDILQTAEALVDAGYGGDTRMSATMDFLMEKREREGRWRMEYSYHGKTWSDPEPKGQPSKWVTLRAMRVLKAGGQLSV